MTPPPFDLDLEHCVRRYGAALRQLAVALLGDASTADDAVQATWIAALQRPPRHDAALGGWFATLLRNVVGGWRRRERRRAVREQSAALARGEATEDHAAVLAREEIVQRLMAALATLDAPFRDVIWQRYFEGKAPRAIATASGVPVATVKSRLQRGLGMLRARLGEEDRDRSDWRSAFAAAFGLEKGTAATVAVAGGLVMATWMKVTGALAAAAIAVVLCWPGAASPPMATMSRDGAARPSPAVADLGAKSETAPEIAASAAPRAEAPLAAPRDAKVATIRGRCIDEKGAPVAGCKVMLNGWRCNQERVDAWLRDHPEPQWENPPPKVTGEDGVFAFTFWPPPPFQFVVQVGGDELAAMSARWSAIEEGRVVDLGDVIMVPGIRVQGRVVDETGSPVTDADVNVTPGRDANTGDRETPSFSYTAGRSKRDGSFRCYSTLPAGPCRIECHGPDNARLAKSIEVTLSRERPVEDLVLVLPATRQGPTITGCVVDEEGRPVHGARVEACSPVTGSCVNSSTRRDGSFTLTKNGQDPGDRWTLSSTHELFERCVGEHPVEWGSRDVVLTMRATGGLAVYVCDEEGRAITDFGVRVIPRESTSFSSDHSQVRARGSFDAGFAAVPGIGVGKWTALIEFPTAMQLASVVVPFDKAVSGIRRVDAVARGNAQRTVHVVDADDHPVAGAKVQLCLPMEGEFGEATVVGSLQRVLMLGSSVPFSRALLLTEDTTAADGTLVVTGPRHVDLGVAVVGAEHVPVRVGRVRLDESSPLLVRVASGSRLRGALAPREAFTEMLRLTSAPKGELRLLDPDQATGRMVPATWFEPGFPIADDGTFDVGGLPPGRWRVVTMAGSTFELGEVELRAGQTTRFDASLASLLPGTLKGVIQTNGAPLKSSPFQLRRIGAGMFQFLCGTTDDEGRFELRMPAGVYRAFVNKQGVREVWGSYTSTESATVTVGEVVEQRFGIWTGAVKLTLRDASGAPVPGLRLRITGADPSERIWLAPSDGQGCIEGELLAEPVVFEVLPKSLQTEPAQRQLREQLGMAGGDPVETRWMRIGSATITAGQTTKLELKLPAEWDR